MTRQFDLLTLSDQPSFHREILHDEYISFVVFLSMPLVEAMWKKLSKEPKNVLWFLFPVKGL